MSITPDSALVLKGRISDPTSGAAIAGCAIDALPLNADGTFGAPIAPAATTTNGQGLYTMNVGAASPTGRYVVKVRDPVSGKTRYIFPAISMQVDMLYGTIDGAGEFVAPLPDASIKTSQYKDASVTYVKLAADVVTGLDPRFVNTGGDTMTGPLLVQGTPLSIAGTLDPDTGLVWDGSGLMRVVSDGANLITLGAGEVTINNVYLTNENPSGDQTIISPGLIEFYDTGSPVAAVGKYGFNTTKQLSVGASDAFMSINAWNDTDTGIDWVTAGDEIRIFAGSSIIARFKSLLVNLDRNTEVFGTLKVSDTLLVQAGNDSGVDVDGIWTAENLRVGTIFTDLSAQANRVMLGNGGVAFAGTISAGEVGLWWDDTAKALKIKYGTTTKTITAV